MLEVFGLPPGAGIRVAALDTYDGIVYSVGGSDGNTVSGQFARVPYQLDQSDAEGRQHRSRSSSTVRRGVGARHRPARAHHVQGCTRRAERTDTYFYNDVTGTGATQDGLEAGDLYEATSMVPVAPQVTSPTCTPGLSVLPAAPDLPDELARLLERWAPASGGPGERLADVVEGFREGYVSHGLDGTGLQSVRPLARPARRSSPPSGRCSVTASSTRSPRR